MIPSQRYCLNAPQVIADVIGGEAVIVNLSTGSYFSLRDTAAIIWQALEQGEAIDDLITNMIQQYTGSAEVIRSSILELISKLIEEDLIIPVESASAENQAPREFPAHAFPDRVPFQVPVVEKYTDMADLLLLDPIHEVDEDQGWPRAKVAIDN